MERNRIQALGGSISKSMQVVWEHKKLHGGVTVIEKIPLLNIARSLGDLWSVTDNNQYLISRPGIKWGMHCWKLNGL